MEHCTPYTRAVHTATCLERKVAERENWYQLIKLLPGGFHTCCGQKFTTTGCREHVSQVAKGNYHFQLVRPDSNFPLWSAVLPCTPVIRVLCQALEPTAFLMHPVQTMLLLPTSVRQTAHGNSPELCRRSSPVPQIMIFVFL